MGYTIGQRVQIRRSTDCLAPPPPTQVQQRFFGRTAKVVSIRRRDDGATIELEDPADPVLGKVVLVYPRECQILK